MVYIYLQKFNAQIFPIEIVFINANISIHASLK